MNRTEKQGEGCWVIKAHYGPEQGFSSGVPQEFLKHAMPDYLARGTDLFSLKLSGKKMTTVNTAIAV